MNLEELRKHPHLSISAINDYIDCGLLYKFSRVDRLIPEFKADVLAFGTSIHRTLQDFYQSLMEGYRMTLNEIREQFELHWHQSAAQNKYIRYGPDQDFNSLLQTGLSLLNVWYEKQPEEDFRLIAVEEPFCFTLPDVPVPIIGAIDLIQEDQSRTLIITDHKTPAKAMSDDNVHSSQQLTIYQMAARINGYADREIILKFDCLIKTKKPKFEQYYTSRTRNDEKRMIRKIHSVWTGISKGVFVPNDLSWKCKNCSYQSACSQWFLKEAA